MRVFKTEFNIRQPENSGMACIFDNGNLIYMFEEKFVYDFNRPSLTARLLDAQDGSSNLINHAPYSSLVRMRNFKITHAAEHKGQELLLAQVQYFNPVAPSAVHKYVINDRGQAAVPTAEQLKIFKPVTPIAHGEPPFMLKK